MGHYEVKNRKENEDKLKNKDVPEQNKPHQPLIWKNVIRFSLLHATALYGICVLGQSSWKTIFFNWLYGMTGHLGITAGVHRLWSHRSYKASLPLRIFLAACNSIALQNSIFEWARDHRVHHKHSETDADPHNAKRGFFFSHIGWLVRPKLEDVKIAGSKLDISDLLEDPVVAFQKKYYRWTTLIMCFLIPTFAPYYFWGESLSNAFFVTMLRYIMFFNCTLLVNSAAHMWGNKPYDVTINPAENVGVSILTMGEGFHNYHHVFPQDYRTSEFGIRLNITTAFIELMAFLGLAWDLKTVAKETVLTRRARTGDMATDKNTLKNE